MKTLADIREQLSYVVNFNNSQADQSFAGTSADTNKRVDAAINEAYREEIMLAKQQGMRHIFLQRGTWVWPVSQTTQEMPVELEGKDIEAILDVTNGVPGSMLQITDGISSTSGMYRHSNNKWVWYPAPSQASTLDVVYVATPDPMTRETDTPDLIPEQHRDLIVWSAAVILRQIADEGAPEQWLMRRRNLRHQFWKAISVGNPRQRPGVARIRNQSPDSYEGF